MRHAWFCGFTPLELENLSRLVVRSGGLICARGLISRVSFLMGFATAIFILFARSVFASVAINEVFFDPSGSDTGLEKIELYNNSGASVSLGGWQLYPDGIGYFSFPAGFSLAPYSFVTAHLRVSGTDDAQNLYHISPAANMGNSSGSIALFIGEPRGKETIVDFVRYHKPGSSEKKTWESAAGAVGLWIAGQFVDIGGFQEGKSIALAADGVREGASSWIVVSSPTIGGLNAGSRDIVSEISQVVQEPENENPSAASSISPQLEISASMPLLSDSASTVPLSFEAPITPSMPSSSPPSTTEEPVLFPHLTPQSAIVIVPPAMAAVPPSLPKPISVITPSPLASSSFSLSMPQQREKLELRLEEHILSDSNKKEEEKSERAEASIPPSNQNIAAAGIFSTSALFFAASAILGILAAAGYLFFRLR